jgi:uncharacterized protein (TIGR00251 family)
LSKPGLKLNLRAVGTGVMLKVRLTPKSGRDEIVGVEAFGEEAVLKARVRALPEEGKANQALERLIAHWLRVPPSSVSVAQGGKSRLKQVLVNGDAAMLARADRGSPRRFIRLGPRRSPPRWRRRRRAGWPRG